MAMTKAEKQHLQDLERQLREAKALRFTDPVEVDLPPPDNFRALSKGWSFWVPTVYLRHNSPRVEKACSSSISHGTGWEKVCSQNPRWLYSTELLAWKAARREAEEETARLLAYIDERIENLQQESK